VDSLGSLIFSPILQGGFAGIAGAMLLVVVWVVRELLKVQRQSIESNQTMARVVEQNTKAIEVFITDRLKDSEHLKEILHKMRDCPCLGSK
jgi:hypothetical protein